MANFDKAFTHVLGVEGKYSNHPADRGGPTNWGITQARYSEYLDRPASIEDVKSMTRDTAKKIYKRYYWDAMNLDSIEDDTLAMLLFDQGVNRGPQTAVMELQAVLNRYFGKNLAVDGDLGAKTIEAIESVNILDLYNEFIQNAQDDYVSIVKNNESQLVFLAGWINRSQKLMDAVFERIKLIKDSAKAPLPVKEQPDMGGMEGFLAKIIEFILGLFGADNQQKPEEQVDSPVPAKYMFAYNYLKETGAHESKIMDFMRLWINDTRANYSLWITLDPHDTKDRWFRFSLKDQALVSKIPTAHGEKSDPDNDGLATVFSNTPNSHMSCLGRFLCAETYYGKHGLSLRLDGLDPTNSNARSRAIVGHEADYVPGGRSWGCPAIPVGHGKAEFNALKNGSPAFIYHSSMVR